MPRFDVSAPVSSAPIDRLALGVGWVRPGVAGIGGTLPAPLNFRNNPPYCGSICFEGNEE